MAMLGGEFILAGGPPVPDSPPYRQLAPCRSRSLLNPGPALATFSGPPAARISGSSWRCCTRGDSDAAQPVRKNTSLTPGQALHRMATVWFDPLPCRPRAQAGSFVSNAE
jgi:hypothetical protein